MSSVLVGKVMKVFRGEIFRCERLVARAAASSSANFPNLRFVNTTLPLIQGGKAQFSSVKVRRDP